jgi:hypothetical protein
MKDDGKAPDAGADRPSSLSTRRNFLWGGAMLSGMALAGGDFLPEAGAESGPAPIPEGRAGEAYKARLEAARLQRDRPASRPVTNGDEEDLPGRIASFTKCLPHGARGEVDAGAYDLLLKALRTGTHKDFELIPLGGQVKLANPQAALAWNLIGPDAAQPALAPPPRFGSAEQAAEAVELYWQALARDIPFAEYDSNPLIARAAEDLSRLSAFQAPKEDGRVTSRTIFRGPTPGELAGPYISQLLWKDIPFTPIRVEQKLRIAVPSVDYMTAYAPWLACQNGALAAVNRFDPRPHYIRTGRDLGEYVHRDFTYQAFLGASLILFKMGALPDGANPYRYSRTQSSFTTFGSPYLFYLLAVVTQVALTACWYQKWMVHRRLRPEEFAGRVDVHLQDGARYPLDGELLTSTALEEVRRKHGSALLPMAYPEGCPAHPSYPAGHAVIGGACVTVLKAFFDESYVVPDPVVPSPDGLSLVRYQGPPLTVGGELDKLAANIGLGRDFAGVHWRSDTTQGLALGEEVAIGVLEEMKLTGNELFQGFSFQRFDGTRATV